ncbi:NeuD/PglB/VioB family sugar acetyltransferase [Actinomycetota bacterium]
MNAPLWIIGAGGHGREVAQLVLAINSHSPTWQLAGFADDAPSAQNHALVQSLGDGVIGGVNALLQRPPGHYVIGIGNGPVRREIDRRMSDAGWQAATLIHPHATLGRDIELQPGCIVWAGARLTTNIRCGRHVHLNSNATVGHDTVLEDYVTLNPLAAVSGGVRLGQAVTVGASATVLQYLEVGAETVVGAGAVVVRSVDPGRVVKGVPAR